MVVAGRLRSRTAAGLLGLAGMGVVQAADFAPQCPASISTTVSVKGAEAPWQAVADAAARSTLAGVRVYSGPPAEMANLVPDSVKRVKRLETATWQLPKEAGRAYWLACSYHNTALLLARPVPATARSCTLQSETLPSGQVLKVLGVSCQ